MARKIEMHWVCSACHTRNLGRHKKCQHCGDPKDASEPWLMPSDTRAAPSVTDPSLIRQASAGADWQCGYCGSHQKRLDGRCAQCGAAQQDGARVPVGGARPKHAPVLQAHQAAPTHPAPPYGSVRGHGARSSFLRSAARGAGTIALPAALGCGGLTVAGCLLFALLVAFLPAPPPEKPTFVTVEVESLHWQRTIQVERYVILEQDGFVEDRPDDAFDINSLGQAHHHDEQVLDHYETETYWEDVPYEDTETYTDQEQCGEDCTSSPQSCHEVCTPDDNGFASCHDECSGGGQSCTPRYCSVTRTRSVTRYRQEQRTRQVPRYRTEPRFAERFSWRVWRWRHDRDVTADGDGSAPPRWPTRAELEPPTPLAEGERERQSRTESLEASLRTVPAGQRESLTLDGLTYVRIQEHPRWYMQRSESTGLALYKPAPDAPRS